MNKTEKYFFNVFGFVLFHTGKFYKVSNLNSAGLVFSAILFFKILVAMYRQGYL
ncbi:hypothetical protein JOD96_001520 [Flavobacterium sp. 1355]|nr:hypothetical protein [Flavobacterium sp. 1355]